MNPQTQYVVDIMTQNPVVVGPEVASWSADHIAENRGVHYLLVIDGYRLVGVVCSCDLHRAGASTHVGSYMHAHPETIDDQETAVGAAARMAETGIGCLPVVDWCGTLRGVVTRHDLRDAGFLHPDQVLTCASCGSTHGLAHRHETAAEREAVRFCQRCLDETRHPQSTIDETYFTVGGSG